MREIKFRAWDKANKMWWEKWSNVYFLSLEGRFLEEVAGDMGEVEDIKESDEATERFILCQYTGLKDKNEKEIFEGDVVKYGEKVGTIAVVTFNHGAFWIGGGLMANIDFEQHPIEVIGNIYEHPELLE